MKIIGIDPGINGAIAAISKNDSETHVNVYEMPETERDIHDLFQSLVKQGYKTALIEKVASMPGNAARSMFTFGRGYGAVRMAMICNGIVFEEVLPRAWQETLGIVPRKKVPKSEKTVSKDQKRKLAALSSLYKKEHKNQLKAKAQQLFPYVRVSLQNADALLICEHAHRRSGSSQ